MEKYSELFYQVRSNNKRMENIDKNHGERTFYKNDVSDSFSVRMISVMLILVSVMFLKQSGVFDESRAYQSVMAEIHRQVTVKEIESVVTNTTVYPFFDWMDNKNSDDSY